MPVINGTTGVDTLNGTAGADTINGLAGDDLLRGLNGADVIDGGTGYDYAGFDTDAANGGAAGVIVNLAAGVALDGFGNLDTLIGIEAARGTAAADTFIGSNRTDDVEQYQGLAGNDYIDGAGGQDEVRYDRDASYGGAAGVIVNLTTGTGRDGFGNTDTLVNIERVRGTNAADTITGNGGNNQFRGLGGADSFDGGAGFDTLRYESDQVNGGTAGITVNYTTFGTGTVIDGFGATDTFVSIEYIRGTAFADTMNGNLGGEEFAGHAGNDTLNGGNGFDWAHYDDDEFVGGLAGVTVNLATGTATDGFGNTDTLTGIEGVVGTRFNDVLTGGNASETLNGGDGDDTLTGGRGFDFFSPGRGTNTINGAPGGGLDMGYGDGDTVSYNGLGYLSVTVNFNIGVAAREISPGVYEFDTLIDIERARGTSGNDTFVGSATQNLRQERFQGLAGDDAINGGNGFDVASYFADASNGGTAGIIANMPANIVRDGFGNFDTLFNVEGIQGTNFADTFIGGAGDEFFRGYLGNDSATGGDGTDEIDFYIDDMIGGTGLTINIAAGTATNINGNVTTFSGFENYTGSYRNDTITGSAAGETIFADLGDDVVNAGGGDDTVFGGGGVDTLDGGDGNDWLVFRFDTEFPVQMGYDAAQNAGFNWLRNWNWTGVTVHLGFGSCVGPDGATVTFSNFENVAGTYYNDNLIGDGNNNIFRGSAGNDRIEGGDGIDTVTYAPATSALTDLYIPLVSGSVPNGVTVNLATGTASDGEGGTDTLITIENVIGSLGNDSITGNDGDNTLNGGDGDDALFGGLGLDTLIGGRGNDQLFGAFGNDILTGGAGDDALVGGADIDTATWAGGRSGYSVRTISNGAGGYTTIVSDLSGALGTDAVAQVEFLQFNGQNFGNFGLQQNRISNIDGGNFDDVILWNAATGQNIYANMNGGLNASGFGNIISPSVWRGIGSGDFTGDGRADLLVQNTLNGHIWFYNASGAGGGSWTPVIGATGFTFIDSGDVTGDGDGFVDLLVQYGGTNYIYDINNDTGVGSWLSAGTFAGWNTIGLGDCNRDGRSDMIIQDSATGTTYYRDINTGVFGVVTTALGTSWVARGTGDLNGDGYCDVIFQNTTNGNIWYRDMAGNGWGVVANGLLGWNVEGTGDLDNDGFRDVILRNATTGDIYYANMDNGVLTNFGDIAAGIGTGWQVV